MDYTILADARFGWVFIVTEILTLYVIFLFIHRAVEKKIRRK